MKMNSIYNILCLARNNNKYNATYMYIVLKRFNTPVNTYSYHNKFVTHSCTVAACLQISHDIGKSDLCCCVVYSMLSKLVNDKRKQAMPSSPGLPNEHSAHILCKISCDQQSLNSLSEPTASFNS